MPTLEPTAKRHRSCVRVVKQQVVGSVLRAPEDDHLAIEDPLEIRLTDRTISDRPLTVTMRTPGHDSELIHGFLFAEGIIPDASAIEEITFNNPSPHGPPTQARVRLRDGVGPAITKPRTFAASASCGVCGTTSLENLALSSSLKIDDSSRIDPAWIHSLPDLLQSTQSTFQRTGGLHAAALFDADGTLLCAHEDIGRHNAVDKVIGSALIEVHIPRPGQTLFVSGRMSYEILQKALMARCVLVAGVGSPSSLAVTMANDFGVTLVGFVRDGRYNIYSRPDRLRAAIG